MFTAQELYDAILNAFPPNAPAVKALFQTRRKIHPPFGTTDPVIVGRSKLQHYRLAHNWDETELNNYPTDLREEFRQQELMAVAAGVAHKIAIDFAALDPDLVEGLTLPQTVSETATSQNVLDTVGDVVHDIGSAGSVIIAGTGAWEAIRDGAGNPSARTAVFIDDVPVLLDGYLDPNELRILDLDSFDVIFQPECCVVTTNTFSEPKVIPGPYEDGLGSIVTEWLELDVYVKIICHSPERIRTIKIEEASKGVA